MADDAPLSDPPAPRRRRFFLPGGLSGRLLLATALVVVITNLLTIPVLLSSRQREWLGDKISAGESASFVVNAAAAGKVNEQLKAKILASAGLAAVGVQADGVMRLVLSPARLPKTVYRMDLREEDSVSSLFEPFEILFGGDQMVLVIDRPHYTSGELVEILVPAEPLRAILTANLRELLIGAIITSIMAGAIVFFSLNYLLVRPMRRITLSMERFRADPDDPNARLTPSGRHDEIGRAEVELDRMQHDLRAALASRARLAALGEGVAKINHEMRNMLTSAQLASERLAASGDPVVARTLPRLERALNRAVRLAADVLTFGRSAEPAPTARPTPLRAALEAAAEDAQLAAGGVRLAADVDERAQVLADPDQLHRIFVNLMRNAREAIDSDEARKGAGAVSVGLRVENGVSLVRIADNGPGLPERAQANLFQPFLGSARRDGTGLGLSISRELAQAHGGDLALIETGPAGAVFELRLPGAPEPLAAS